MTPNRLIVRGGIVVTPEVELEAEVIVEDGKIAAITPSAQIGSGDTVIDGSVAGSLQNLTSYLTR